MFYTGRRTIFDVSRDHIGHSIEILPIEREGVITGIKYYCRTCSEVLLQQNTSSWETEEQVTVNRVSRLRSLGYEVKDFDAWQQDFIHECYVNDGETPRYEGSEWDEVYNDYLDRIEFPNRGRQRTTGWDTQDTGWTT